MNTEPNPPSNIPMITGVPLCIPNPTIPPNIPPKIAPIMKKKGMNIYHAGFMWFLLKIFYLVTFCPWDEKRII